VALKNHLESVVNQKGDEEGVMTPQLFPLTKGTWQSNDKKFIRVDNILNSWMIVHIYKGKLSSVSKGTKPIASFVSKMDDAHNLIDGQQLTYIFAPRSKRSGEEKQWEFYYSDTQNQNQLDSLLRLEAQGQHERVPKVLLQIYYLNSIFTRKKGKGRCKLLIRSWMTNEDVLPTNARALLTLKDGNGKVVQMDSSGKEDPKKNKWLSIGETKEFVTKDPMMTLDMSIEVEEPSFFGSKFKVIGSYTFSLADFFGNYRIAAIMERFYHLEFIDGSNTKLIKITCQPLFEPSDRTKQEEEEWARNKERLQKSEAPTVVNRTQSLMKKSEPVLVDEGQRLKDLARKKFRIKAPDYQGLDIFRLKLESAKTEFAT
jgi:hypothetical protein